MVAAGTVIGRKSAGIDWAAEAALGPAEQPALAPPRQLAVSAARMRTSTIFQSFNREFGINARFVGFWNIF